MATIHDVARRVGVAPSTVSRYINGVKVRRAPEIEAAIRELGFRASASARHLRRGSTRAVAMIVPDIQNPYYAAAVAGAEAVGRENGLRLFLSNTDEDVDLEQEVLEDVIERVDGVILVPASESSSTALFDRSPTIPLVLMDREISGPLRFDTVVVENYEGGRAAAEHLVRLGHRDIGLISGPLSASQSRAREQGFRDGLQAAGVTLDARRCERGDFRENGGYQAMLDALSSASRPTAVFVVNNLMTIGALRAIRDQGLSVPDDISVVAFDQLPFAALVSPRMTTISRPMEEQGAMAMRMLLSRLRSADGAQPPRKLALPTDLIVGASTRSVDNETA